MDHPTKFTIWRALVAIFMASQFVIWAIAFAAWFGGVTFNHITSVYGWSAAWRVALIGEGAVVVELLAATAFVAALDWVFGDEK